MHLISCKTPRKAQVADNSLLIPARKIFMKTSLQQGNLKTHVVIIISFKSKIGHKYQSEEIELNWQHNNVSVVNLYKNNKV